MQLLLEDQIGNGKIKTEDRNKEHTTSDEEESYKDSTVSQQEQELYECKKKDR